MTKRIRYAPGSYTVGRFVIVRLPGRGRPEWAVGDEISGMGLEVFPTLRAATAYAAELVRTNWRP